MPLRHSPAILPTPNPKWNTIPHEISQRFNHWSVKHTVTSPPTRPYYISHKGIGPRFLFLVFPVFWSLHKEKQTQTSEAEINTLCRKSVKPSPATHSTAYLDLCSLIIRNNGVDDLCCRLFSLGLAHSRQYLMRNAPLTNCATRDEGLSTWKHAIAAAHLNSATCYISFFPFGKCSGSSHQRDDVIF